MSALRVVVAEAASGFAVQGAEVRLYGPSDVRLRTDSSGAASSAALRPGRYVVVTRQFGYRYWRQDLTLRRDESFVLRIGLQGEVCR